jgi:hypothetical protein
MIHIIPSDETNHEETPHCPCKPYMELAQNIDGSIRTLGTPVMIHLSKEQIDMKSFLLQLASNFMTWERFKVNAGLFFMMFVLPPIIIGTSIHLIFYR